MCDANNPLSPELAQIFSDYKEQLHFATDRQWKVINAITACRTAKLGGDLRYCEHCGHTEIHYHSCRDRHCPKCQSLKKESWILKRDSELLPVGYFHLVFTVSHELLALFQLNHEVCYSLLFEAVAKTIKTAAANPKNLGADSVGFFSILHTWDQKLNYHPHIHTVIPGGGLAANKSQWIASRKSFFISVRILSRIFRGVFCRLLEKSFANSRLILPPGEHSLKQILYEACRKDWVVYAKPPFNGPHWVVRYLARYTNKIAISNYRLISINNGQVAFTWSDRDHGYAKKQCSLPASEFMRRFLLHILPPGFVRIRHYGFLGNVCRKESVALIRSLLGSKQSAAAPVPDSWKDLYILVTGSDPDKCKVCGNTPLISRQIAPSCPGKAAG